MDRRTVFWIVSCLVGFLLIGFLIPLKTGPQIQPLPIQAESTAYNLVNSITAYFAEYREYPLLDAVDDITTDSGHGLMDILLGSEKEMGPGNRNPRGIVFFTHKKPKATGDGRFSNGITLNDDGGGELWDPWGNFYRVRFDSDDNDRVGNPDPSITSSFLSESIIIWSAGPDGDFDTWNDNVKTW